MLRRQLVVAKRRTKASKTFGVFETPFPTAPPPVKYSTGDRAGETVPAEVPFRFRDAAPETTTRDGHDAGVHTLLGRTAEYVTHSQPPYQRTHPRDTKYIQRHYIYRLTCSYL
eukprot:TRINITY_DN17290_c0_g1_i3.p1 TRINITY_DN17290_c0_g1~~TRINITY_DN17290_c0_g1_i3.p1  ORF type:complete len:113 (+),score=0.36 TRINITY_DN17290_c0_g1_i3:100-438(+)